jgi:hypothetical protein
MTDKDVKQSLAVRMMPKSRSCQQKRRNSAAPLLPGQRKSRKIFGACLGGRQYFLISGMRGRRLVCDKVQLEVVNDPVHYGIVGEESDDLHRGAAVRADHRINFIDLL